MIFRLYPNLLSLFFEELEIPLLKLLTIVIFGGVIAIVESLQVLDFVLVINMLSSSFIAKSFKALTCVLLIYFCGHYHHHWKLICSQIFVVVSWFSIVKTFCIKWVQTRGGGVACSKVLNNKKSKVNMHEQMTT